MSQSLDLQEKINKKETRYLKDLEIMKHAVNPALVA